ncbi:MAG: RHS repeat-associated core domain-containing protein [Chloroflexi bacterium]|nr:RHS repeat-associated core domain-containing protein [Chloroflexota bacterium]
MPGSRTSYLPYGETRPGSGTPATDYRFTGQRLDDYINLYQMGARWYDAELGRWISPDSIIPEPGNPQALNRYSYAYNNPVRFIDPSGHAPIVGEDEDGDPVVDREDAARQRRRATDYERLMNAEVKLNSAAEFQTLNGEVLIVLMAWGESLDLWKPGSNPLFGDWNYVLGADAIAVESAYVWLKETFGDRPLDQYSADEIKAVVLAGKGEYTTRGKDDWRYQAFWLGVMLDPAGSGENSKFWASAVRAYVDAKYGIRDVTGGTGKYFHDEPTKRTQPTRYYSPEQYKDLQKWTRYSRPGIQY